MENVNGRRTRDAWKILGREAGVDGVRRRL